jgi:RNA polymerase sigma-70 factor (sigma-E family)
VDEASFERQVVASGAALLRLAVMLAGEPHSAEDLVQSTLVKAYRKWPRVAAAEYPEAYLKAMVVNEYLSWRRRRSSHELPTAVVDDRPTAEDVGRAHAARAACWELLGGLPRQQRAVLVLRYYEDLPDERIAEVLGCGVSTVRSNATRALARLLGRARVVATCAPGREVAQIAGDTGWQPPAGTAPGRAVTVGGVAGRRGEGLAGGGMYVGWIHLPGLHVVVTTRTAGPATMDRILDSLRR